jgi:hypothetical protein
MVATSRLRFDSLLEQIMELVLKKNFASEARVREFSSLREDFFFLMKTYRAVLPHRPSF